MGKTLIPEEPKKALLNSNPKNPKPEKTLANDTTLLCMMAWKSDILSVGRWIVIDTIIILQTPQPCSGQQLHHDWPLLPWPPTKCVFLATTSIWGLSRMTITNNLLGTPAASRKAARMKIEKKEGEEKNLILILLYVPIVLVTMTMHFWLHAFMSFTCQQSTRFDSRAFLKSLVYPRDRNSPVFFAKKIM